MKCFYKGGIVRNTCWYKLEILFNWRITVVDPKIKNVKFNWKVSEKQGYSKMWTKWRFSRKSAKNDDLIGTLQRRKPHPYPWSGIL